MSTELEGQIQQRMDEIGPSKIFENLRKFAGMPIEPKPQVPNWEDMDSTWDGIFSYPAGATEEEKRAIRQQVPKVAWINVPNLKSPKAQLHSSKKGES